MAKYETRKKADFYQLKEHIKKEILNKSSSATLEDTYETMVNDVRCATLIFERYSAIGGNRASLSVTLIGFQGLVHIVGITSGGSSAMFFKMNTFGEEAFLNQFIEVLEEYEKDI